MYNKKGLAVSRIISIVMLASISAVAILQLTGTIDILSWTLNPTFGQTNSNKVEDNTFILTEEGVPYNGGVTFGDENDAPERIYVDPDSMTEGLPPGIILSSGGELTGTPTKEGTYTFVICADWADGDKSCQKTSMIVKPKLEPKPNQVVGSALSGKWEGIYKVHRIFDGAYTCTSDTTASIHICVTQQGQDLTGIITFHDGFKDTTISAEPDLSCPTEPHCSGGSGNQCSEFIGKIDSNGNVNINTLTLDGFDYTFNPHFPKTNQGEKQASATISTNSMIFNFNSEAFSSTNTGSFTATKVADNCNT